MAIPYEQLVEEDLNLGFGDVEVTMPAGGVATGQKVGLHTLMGDVYNLQQDFGGVNDGTASNDSQWEDAIGTLGDAGGGILYVPRGTYKTTRTAKVDRSNIEVWFARGAELLFQPTVIAAGSDRAVLVHSGDTNIGGNVAITGAIAMGATSFVAGVTGVVAGDWLLVQETDAGSGGNIVVFDYVQVLSVVGSTINLVVPIRRAFPATHSGVFYNKVSDANLVQHVVLRNVRVRTTDAVNSLPSLFVGVARNTLLDKCVALQRKGNGYACYRTSNLTVRHCFQRQGDGQATEFASAAGLIVDGLVGETNDANLAGTSALVLDFGTHAFSVTNCRLGASSNIAVQLTAIANGVFAHNFIDYVLGPAAYNTLAVTMLGCQGVQVKHNRFIGGQGATSVGLAAGDTSGYTVNIASSGNEIGPNRITGFTSQYFTRLETDLYLVTYGTNDFESSGPIYSIRGAGGNCFVAMRSGDTASRWSVDRDGLMTWGDGTTSDFNLKRTSAGLLTTSKHFRTEGHLLYSLNTVVLVNGANADIAIGDFTYVVINGPTGAFSISGFTGPLSGCPLLVFNNCAFAMTITNDAGSTAANRILTLTGADVVLRAGKSFAMFIYDVSVTRWVLMASN